MALSEQAILDYLSAHPDASREAIRRHVAPDASATTFWRALKRLVSANQVEVSGKGTATKYRLAGTLRVRAHVATPPQLRPPITYQKGFLDRYVPNKAFYLSEQERRRLQEAGRPVGALPAGTRARRILERLLVDLSWASSRMEGNTYSLLDTERLIRLGHEASGKDRKEALMILNHKEAIQYVVDNLESIAICSADICNVHALLAGGLLVDPAMAGRVRRLPVGIHRSSYRPLEDEFDIAEEFRILIEKAAAIEDAFEQSFFLCVHIPYLQAFDDVNKRTSRVSANIPLLKNGLAPLSFLTMNDSDYIDGLIGIYELNDVSLLRDAFVDAYLTSAEHYRVLRAEVETPEKAAVQYREVVREAVRRCVLEWKAFKHSEVIALIAAAGVPEVDQREVADFVRREIRGLHEGNAIRYRLRADDLIGLDR